MKTCADTAGGGDFNGTLEDVEVRALVVTCADITRGAAFDGSLEVVAAKEALGADPSNLPSTDPNEKLVAVVLKGLDPER